MGRSGSGKRTIFLGWPYDNFNTLYSLHIISHRLFGLKGHLKYFREKKIGCLHGKKYFTKITKGYKKIERSIKYKICQTSKKDKRIPQANLCLLYTSDAADE